MDPSIGIIDDGDLLIDDGKIIAIGQKLGSWAVMEIDGRGMIAMPGLINGHIHLWQTALRGVAADWTLDQYFGVLIGQVVRLYTPEDVYIGNLVGALDQINSGVTTLLTGATSSTHAQSRQMQAVDALQDAGIRAVFAYGTPMTLVCSAPRSRTPSTRATECVATGWPAAMGWSQWRSPSGGTDFAPGTTLSRIFSSRATSGLWPSFHVACAKHGPRPQSMQSLADQRLLGPDLNLVHANFLTADEFRVIANHGVSTSITPEVEMQMGLGLPPDRRGPRRARKSLNIGTDVVTGA